MANFFTACILASWVAVVVAAAAGGSPTYAPSEAPVVIGSPIYAHAPSEPPVVAGGPGYAPSQAPSSVAAAPGSEAGVGGDCSTLIYEMMECMSFLSGEGGETAAPGEPCCAGFKTVVDANADCICYALGSAASLGLVINITRAAALPSLCRVSAPPISYCHASLSPSESPVSSPPTASSPVFPPPSGSPANSPTHGSSALPSNSPSTLPRLTPPPAPATSAPKSAPPPATSGTTVPPTATSPPSLAPAATSDDTTMPPNSEATAPPPQKAGAYSISPAYLLVFASFLLFSA